MRCGHVKVFCVPLTVIIRGTPAVAAKQHLSLSSLCIQTAAASYDGADKLEIMKHISHYSPTSSHDIQQLQYCSCCGHR